jgi:8-oxo-dGTP pyrophosphatase MutT (NUDIX family)
MGPHTAPAGQIYFPAGTPDRHDIVGTKVDIEGSARRELREETGLDVDRLIFEPGLTLVMEPVRLCCMKHIRSPEKAETLVTRIHAWLANEPKPELIRMHIVREPRDITSAMPGFVIAYLRSMLANR